MHDEAKRYAGSNFATEKLIASLYAVMFVAILGPGRLLRSSTASSRPARHGGGNGTLRSDRLSNYAAPRRVMRARPGLGFAAWRAAIRNGHATSNAGSGTKVSRRPGVRSARITKGRRSFKQVGETFRHHPWPPPVTSPELAARQVQIFLKADESISDRRNAA